MNADLPNQQKDNAFRADIEGLRAFAVLAVLVFHLDSTWLPGGFVGVDVFLVISGYIITRQLLGLSDRGAFSLKDFWIRRIKRLYPAMLVVIGLTMVGGFFIMNSAHYKETAESGLAAIAMGANIFFADRVGYFAAAAETRPLLHFWSLSFEQQFYLLVPLLFIWKQTHHRLAWIMGGIIVISLATGLFMVRYDPDRAFYMPFGRFWELGVGALVAIIATFGTFQNIKGAAALALTGLTAVIASFVFIHADAAFPDEKALIPVLGTAAIIIAGYRAHPLQKLFTNPFMRWHGRLSYTLYLVHWPVIVFHDMIAHDAPMITRLMIVLAITYVLTLLIHHLIETPLRHNKNNLSRHRYAFASVFFLAAVPAAYIALSSGATWRLPAQAKAIDTYQSREPGLDINKSCETVETDRNFGRGTLCKLVAQSTNEKAQKTFAMVGDSHMGMLAWEVIDFLYKNGFGQAYIVRMPTGCPPLYDITAKGRENRRDCGPASKALFDALKEIAPDKIIIAGRWANFGAPIPAPSDNKPSVALGVHTEEDKEISFKAALARTINFLSPLSVTLIGPVPEQGFDVPSRMVTASILGQKIKPMGRALFEKRQSFVLSAMESLKEKATVLYPHEILCGVDACAYADDITPLYYDDDHLTRTGVLKILPIFQEGSSN